MNTERKLFQSKKDVDRERIMKLFFFFPCLEPELNEIAAKHAALFRYELNTSEQVDRLSFSLY